MSKHSTTLVPLATGYFQSPDLFVNGQPVDTGLFAEALVYYESIYVHVDNPLQFEGFISLLVQQGCSYDSLIELVEEGILRFYSSIFVMPYMGSGVPNMVSSLWAIQEEAMNEPDYFTKKFLEFDGLRNSFSIFNDFQKSHFERFREATEKTAVFFNNEQISAGLVDRAYEDFLNPKRNKLIVKNLLKETFKANGLGKPPKVSVNIREVDSNYHEIAANIESSVVGRNFENGEYKIYEIAYNKELLSSLRSLENTKTPLLKGLSTLPLSAAGLSNLIIRSANLLNCDLFLAKPICKTIGDKLFEIAELRDRQTMTKMGNVVETLKAKVEFPDLRRLVNEGKIDFVKVIEIRKKAGRFRDWLQSEAERDRDAIVAYHNEVAKQTGFSQIGKTTLNIFGVLASVSLAVSAEAFFWEHEPISKEALKQVGSKSIDALKQKASRVLFDEWRPVCFGDWYKKEIAELLQQTEN